MNRTDRLVAMVMFFQSRRLVRAEELAAHFEISVRTVYRDVSALCEAGVPISGEAGVGYSLVKGYHLPPVMFTGEEAMALFVGSEMVKHFTDASLSGPMDTAVLKLRAVLPREQQDDVDRLSRAMLVDGAGTLRGGLDQRNLLPIQQAVVARRALRLTYRSKSQDEDLDRIVEPMGVAFHSGAWYLVAWCRLRGAYRQFKLERVRALSVLPERFPARPDFSLGDHLGKAMSMVLLLPVRVWFASSALERARRETYCGFEEERSAGGGVEVRFCTFSHAWLARWILSFGGEAEALAPPELRQAVAKLAREISARHSDKSSVAC